MKALKKTLKFFISWKSAVILIILFVIQYLLAYNWAYISIYLSNVFPEERIIEIAAKELYIPYNIKIERIDHYDTTGKIKIIYLRSTDCLIIVSRIERLESEDWEKMLDKIYEIYKFEEYPDKNFFYAINANDDELIAYQLTDYIEKERYLSQNFFFILDQIFFEFYGPDTSPEKAMDYLRKIFYHDIEKDFDWDYIRVTEIEDLKL